VSTQLNSVSVVEFYRVLRLFKRILATFICCIPSSHCQSLDSELWLFNHFILEKEEDREIFLSLHGRASDLDSPTLYQIQPRFAVPIDTWIWGGFNYSFFGIRNSNAAVKNEDLFTNQHRLEGEIQLRLSLNEGVKYVGRNRFEHLLEDNFNEVNNRFRHRSQFLFSSLVPEVGTVVSQIELFYDFDQDRLNQTRSAPLGLRITSGSWTVQVQPMLINLHLPDMGWRTRVVGNIEITFEL
jgi:hypothetical protein